VIDSIGLKGNDSGVIKYSIFLVFCYYFSVFFFPRIGGITGHYRYEDVLTLFLILGLILTLKKSYVFINFSVLIYCAFITFFSLLNVFFERSAPYSILILGKEIQYYIAFILSLNVLSNLDIPKVFNFFLFPSLFLIFIFSSYSMFYGFAGVYGLNYLTEHSPSLSAIMYFNCFFLSIVMVHYYKNNKKINYFFSLLFAIIFFISVIATASRTAVIIILFFLTLYIFVFSNIKTKFLLISIIIVFSFLIYFNRLEIYEYISNNKPDNLIFHMVYGRLNSLLLMFDSIDVIKGARLNSWSLALSKVDYTNIIFGQGRGYFSATDGMKGLGTDSQYTRNIVEIGFIGFLLFFVMILSSFRYLYGKWKALYLVYILSYIIWGVAVEIFLLTKGAQMFWFSTALLLALSRAESSNIDENMSKLNNNKVII